MGHKSSPEPGSRRSSGAPAPEAGIDVTPTSSQRPSSRGSTDSPRGTKKKAAAAAAAAGIDNAPPPERSSSTHLDLIVEGLLNAEDPLDYFTDLKIIGHGGTAEVYKATRKSDGSMVALKKFRQDSLLSEIANELRTLRLCAHKYINGYVEGFIWEQRVYLCLAYCVGSLTDILHIFKEPLQEREIAAVARHCLDGLHHIHTKCNTVHRDIKANNILLSADGKAMIGDFGISKVLEGDQKASTFIGSPYWMAPEVILAMETGTYSYAVDVWSLGITLIELAETKPPLFDLHAMSACYHIANNPPPTLSEPAQWSVAFVDFLSQCLALSPEDRWNTKQLMEHDFLVAHSSMESKSILKDLIRRSRLKRAEVNGFDISVLANSGLLSNAEAAMPAGEQGVAGGDGKAPAAAPPLESLDEVPAEAAAMAGADGAEAEPMTPQKALPPLRGQLKKPSQSKVASAIAEVQANLLATRKTESPEAGPAKDVPRSERPDDTIKLPNLLAAEEAHALGRESINLKSQMKEISKLRAKHTEELRKMTERHNVEVQGLVKSQEHVEAGLKRNHDAALKEHGKETASVLGRMHKAHATSAKRIEDELRKMWSAARREFRLTLKQELKALKKKHGKELSKSALEEMRESFRLRQTKSFDDAERRCYTLELAALKCLSEIHECEFKIERVRSEFELRDQQLLESSALLLEHRTGPICKIQRAHLEAVHGKRVEQQRERHETIEKQLLVEHMTGVEELQRRQRTISKRMTSTLKKVKPIDEEVLRKYAMLQKSRLEDAGSVNGSPHPSQELNIDDLVGTTASAKRWSSKRMSSLSKEARKGLKAAREEHIREQTHKLNDDHLRALGAQMKVQAQHLEDLRRQHAAESIMQRETLTKEVEEFDRKMEKIQTSTTQYNNMEKGNLKASKKEGMKKPFKKYAASIEVQRKLLDSTKGDLRSLYASMTGRARARPPTLSDISTPV